MKLALGLMSGTSADGVSITLASFTEKKFKLFHEKTFPYPPQLSQKILRAAKLKAGGISQLNVELGIFFAGSVQQFLKKFGVRFSSIRVIGSHGQTIYHGPTDNPPNTFQIGEPSVIAERTGIPVVADFRMRDIAAGGEGAPLMPFFDQYFFGDKPRAMQNIGGIANVTVVGFSPSPWPSPPKGARGGFRFPLSPLAGRGQGEGLLAFDNGPGNCLIDLAIGKLTRGKKRFDESGKLAARGKVIDSAIQKMAAHPYFKKSPPKSTGRELFKESFIPVSLMRARQADVLATLTYFTAFTIHQSYQKWIRQPFEEIIVSGGGALNQTLMRHLKNLFSPIPVLSIEKFGIPVQAKEPLAFSFFALRAVEGKINHCPEGTGAKRACVLGKIII